MRVGGGTICSGDISGHAAVAWTLCHCAQRSQPAENRRHNLGLSPIHKRRRASLSPVRKRQVFCAFKLFGRRAVGSPGTARRAIRGILRPKSPKWSNVVVTALACGVRRLCEWRPHSVLFAGGRRRESRRRMDAVGGAGIGIGWPCTPHLGGMATVFGMAIGHDAPKSGLNRRAPLVTHANFRLLPAPHAEQPGRACPGSSNTRSIIRRPKCPS